MDLPSGSPLTTYTLETPWPAALGLLAVGLILLQVAVNRQSRRLLLVGVIGLLLVPALLLTAAFVETSAETLRRRTIEFVEAAVAGQHRAVDEYLDDDVVVLFGVNDVGWTKQELIQRIRGVPLIVHSNIVRDVYSATHEDSSGTTVFIQTTTPRGAYPTPNQWRCEWTRSERDSIWRITQITWERWGTDTVPSLDMLPRRRGP